jgi:hypothetical protein
VPLKRRSTIILHGSTSQKTILNFIIKLYLSVPLWLITVELLSYRLQTQLIVKGNVCIYYSYHYPSTSFGIMSKGNDRVINIYITLRNKLCLLTVTNNSTEDYVSRRPIGTKHRYK